MRFYEEVQQRIADISAIVDKVKKYAQIIKVNIDKAVDHNLDRTDLDTLISNLAIVTKYLDGVGYSFQPSNSLGIEENELLKIMEKYSKYFDDVLNIQDMTSKDCEVFNTQIRKLQSWVEKYRSTIVEESEVLSEHVKARKYNPIISSYKNMILENLSQDEVLNKSIHDYVDYIMEHKDNVLTAYIDQLCNLGDKFIDDHKIDILYLVAKHDMSKYEAEEFEPYRKHWYPTYPGEAEDTLDEYNVACEHHVKNNPHHWDYWLDDSGELIELEDEDLRKMYAVEMLADWTAMSMFYGNEPLDWYNENKSEIKLHPQIQEYIESILPKLHK